MRFTSSSARLALVVVIALAVTAAAGAAGRVTPAQYRATMNGLCLKAKHEAAGVPKVTASSSTARATATITKLFGVLTPILVEAKQITPPPSLAAASRKTTAALQLVVASGNELVAKLRAGAKLKDAIAAVQTNLLNGLSGVQSGFKALGLTSCSSVLGGVVG